MISEGQERGQDKPDYEANRARISVALSEFTMPLLSRIYHAFEGDMVAAIVLGEIACRVTTADAALRSASLACGS